MSTYMNMARGKDERTAARLMLEFNDKDNSTRSCGDCQACCEYLSVDELFKPHWEVCKHQCSTGCGIYGDHPLSCRMYSCGWLSNPQLIPELARPDKIGLVFSSGSLGVQAQTPDGLEDIKIGVIQGHATNREVYQRRDIVDLIKHVTSVVPLMFVGYIRETTEERYVHNIFHANLRKAMTADPTVFFL